jgi:hypothetical protein
VVAMTSSPGTPIRNTQRPDPAPEGRDPGGMDLLFEVRP